MNSTHFITAGPESGPHCFVMAHGAGVGMDAPFMNFFSQALVAAGIYVVRFEFPYMVERRRTGSRRPPDRESVLRQSWHDVIEEFPHRPLVIGGKSMGGRIASLVADQVGALGLVCLGYPFHPPGKPDKLRTEHLRTLQTTTLILQGERDPFGKPEEVTTYDLSPAITVDWLPDGDHSFEPRKRSGRTNEQNWQQAVDVVVGFVKRTGLG